MWHQTHTRYLERRLLIPQIFLPHRRPWHLVIRTQTVPMVSVFKGYMLWTQCLLGKLDTYSWCHSSGCDFISQLWQTCDVSSCHTILTTIQQFEILGHVDFSTRSRGCTHRVKIEAPNDLRRLNNELLPPDVEGFIQHFLWRARLTLLDISLITSLRLRWKGDICVDLFNILDEDSHYHFQYS